MAPAWFAHLYFETMADRNAQLAARIAAVKWFG